MAIHAKANGLMVAVTVIHENRANWVVKAIDEKRQKSILKSDPNNQVFTGDHAVDDAMIWQDKRMIEKQAEKPLSKIDHLRMIVEHLQGCGYSTFSLRAESRKSRVVLIASGRYGAPNEIKVLHQCRRKFGEHSIELGIRLRRWLGQYEHWLTYIQIQQRNGSKNVQDKK